MLFCLIENWQKMCTFYPSKTSQISLNKFKCLTSLCRNWIEWSRPESSASAQKSLHGRIKRWDQGGAKILKQFCFYSIFFDFFCTKFLIFYVSRELRRWESSSKHFLHHITKFNFVYIVAVFIEIKTSRLTKVRSKCNQKTHAIRAEYEN